MEGLVASLVTALNACTHPLLTDIAAQPPSGFWDFLHVHHRFHESVVAKRDFRNPHGTQEVGPFRRICLLERTVRVGTENTCLDQRSQLALR
jgi:hypothetical protein